MAGTWQWVRVSQREVRRTDRALDRAEDQERARSEYDADRKPDDNATQQMTETDDDR